MGTEVTLMVSEGIRFQNLHLTYNWERVGKPDNGTNDNVSNNKISKSSNSKIKKKMLISALNESPNQILSKNKQIKSHISKNKKNI